MYIVLVIVLPILIVTLVVVVARRFTTVAVIAVAVAVLFAFSIARRPFLAVSGTVSLLAVRTIAVVLFIVAFAIFVALLIGGTIFFIRRR